MNYSEAIKIRTMRKYTNILIYQNNSTKFYSGEYNLNKHEFWTQLNYQTCIMSLVVNVKSSHTEVDYFHNSHATNIDLSFFSQGMLPWSSDF